MYPKIISFGDFFIGGYGLLVAAGFFSALWLAARLARRTGLGAESITNLGIYCALAGLLGGKLLMLVLDWEYYWNNPGEILQLSTLRAGGVFHGGIVAALLTTYWYARARRLPILKTMDVFAPALALGHAIGRVGCFLAGCCWGTECRLPWAVTFSDPEAYRLVGVPLGVPLHPAQLYTSAAEAVIFLLTLRRFSKPHKAGSVVGLYLLLHAAARLLIDFFRVHDRPHPFDGPLSATQWIAFGLMALGLWLLRRRGETVTPAG